MTVSSTTVPGADRPSLDSLPGGNPILLAKAFAEAVAEVEEPDEDGGNGGYTPAKAEDEAPAYGDYTAIGWPGEAGEGTIRYETGDGTKVVVDRATNPEMYDRVVADYETMTTLNRRAAGGDIVDGAGAREPEHLKDYKAIEEPGTLGEGIVRYEAEDGWHVVSRRENEAVYTQVVADRQSREGLATSETDGYRRATGDDTPPPFKDTIVGPENEMGPGVIRYEHDGEKVVVSYEDNPDLFDQLVAYHAAKSDGGHAGTIEDFLDDGYDLAGVKAEAPKLEDIATWSVVGDHTVAIETRDGSRTVISADVNPALHAQVSEQIATWDTINRSIGNGYELAPSDFSPKDNEITTFGWPEELGHGLIQFETKETVLEDGRKVEKTKKYVVSEEMNKPLYDRIMDRNEDLRAGDVDELRAKHDLPAQGELDVLSLEIDERSDPDKEDSPRMTVSEAATKHLLDEYRKGIEDGTIAKDDDRAKLVRALEAKAAMSSGRGIIAYEEARGLFGGTWRESDDEQTMMTGSDMQDIIDGGKVDETIAALFSKETIAGDYSKKLDDALGKVPDREGLTQRLDAMLNGPEYIAYIQDLKDQGMEAAAEADISKMVQSLTLLDPEKGQAAAQKLQMNSLTADLDALVGDPSKVSDENKVLATKDLFGLLKGVIKADAFDLPRRTVDTIDKFLNEFIDGKTDQKKVIKAIEEAAAAAEANGGKLSQADLERFSAYVPMKDREGLAGLLGGMADKGMLGSLGGGVSLFSGIYQLVGKGGKLGDEPLERLAIAKDFISFAGASQHFAKLGDNIMQAMGKPGFVDMLGLSKSVPEIWGKEGLWGKKLEEVGTGGGDGKPPRIDIDLPVVSDEFRSQMATAADDIFKDVRAPDVSGVDNSMYDGIADMFDREAAATAGGTDVKPPPGTAARIAGSAIKVLGAVSDGVGGVADIVLGAFTIKSGVESGSDLAKAAGSLQVVSGAFGATAGAIGIAGLFGSVGAAAAFTGPLFLGSVLLAGIGAVVSFFVDHEKKQKATDKEGQWFKDLAADGLLQGDWGDKVEYARYMFHHYGQRDAPEDESIYDYQATEWETFRTTEQQGGSSTNRLDHDRHVDWEGDGKNTHA